MIIFIVTNNIASTLFCLQPSHLTMTLDLKDTIIRSLITPQNYINGLSFPILCSSTTDFSCVVIFFPSIMYIVLCQSYVISKVHACTFVTCSLNVIDIGLRHAVERNKLLKTLISENREDM